MRCNIHLNRPAAGYCFRCGNFFCKGCLILAEDDHNYCSYCLKRSTVNAKVDEGPARGERLAVKLMVHLKNGLVMKGTAYNLDPARGGFHFLRRGRDADADITIKFSDVKYVAIVDSFTSKRRKATGSYQPKGSEVTVVFKDGERIDGYTLKQYSERAPRFSIIPTDERDNRLSILVERSSVEHMSLGRIPKSQELRKLSSNAVRRILLYYCWKHPNVVLTLDELATRVERSARVIERELGVFMEEGLIAEIGQGSRKQLKFSPARDPVARQAISAMAKEIETLYFRKRGAPKPTARPRGRHAGGSRGKWGG